MNLLVQTLTTDAAFDSALTPLSELELALVLGGVESGIPPVQVRGDSASPPPVQVPEAGEVTISVIPSPPPPPPPPASFDHLVSDAENAAVRDQYEQRGGGSAQSAPDSDGSGSDSGEPVQVDEAGDVTVSATPEPKLTNWEEFKQRLENTERREQWQQRGAEVGAKIGIPLALLEEGKKGVDGRLLEGAAKGAEYGATLGRHAGDVIFLAEALKDTYGDDVVDALEHAGEGIGDARASL